VCAPVPVAPGGGGGPRAADLTPEQVRELQRRLDELGYDPGPVDGLMGARTAEAIADFQEDRGLDADGEPTRALLERLREAEPSG
jgi:peptidoglycan hydrolase-like protein with peptidoglycan-binding domain